MVGLAPFIRGMSFACCVKPVGELYADEKNRQRPQLNTISIELTSTDDSTLQTIYTKYAPETDIGKEYQVTAITPAYGPNGPDKKLFYLKVETPDRMPLTLAFISMFLQQGYYTADIDTSHEADVPLILGPTGNSSLYTDYTFAHQ